MWQPIETAPHNRPFLAVLNCAGEQTICTMRWSVAEAKNSRPEVWGRHVERVTHWMPLPELPGAKGEERREMKIEKIPEGYILARKGGNGCELWRTFNGAESIACEAIDELIAERDALRAKIAEMEKQEPVWFIDERGEPKRYYKSKADYCKYGGLDLLYALPGAQPAPSINEGVRKVTLDFRWESEAQHHIPTIEIEFDPVSPESPNDAKGWQDRDRLAAMLTPEDKP